MCLEIGKIQETQKSERDGENMLVVELPASSPSDSSTARLLSNTRTCYMCALRNFKELAYLYRTDIPHDDLPGRCVGPVWKIELASCN